MSHPTTAGIVSSFATLSIAASSSGQGRHFYVASGFPQSPRAAFFFQLLAFLAPQPSFLLPLEDGGAAKKDFWAAQKPDCGALPAFLFRKKTFRQRKRTAEALSRPFFDRKRAARPHFGAVTMLCCSLEVLYRAVLGTTLGRGGPRRDAVEDICAEPTAMGTRCAFTRGTSYE
jgi:hypothetical protein